MKLISLFENTTHTLLVNNDGRYDYFIRHKKDDWEMQSRTIPIPIRNKKLISTLEKLFQHGI